MTFQILRSLKHGGQWKVFPESIMPYARKKTLFLLVVRSDPRPLAQQNIEHKQ